MIIPCEPRSIFSNHKLKKVSLFIFCISLISSNSYGKFYKCKDNDGNTIFSDTACNTSERETVNNYSGPSEKKIENKSLDSCLSYWSNKKIYLRNSNTRVEDHTIELVGVKNIGLRKMVHMTVSFNANNNSPKDVRTTKDLSCLMLGDGITVNTMNYELTTNSTSGAELH